MSFSIRNLTLVKNPALGGGGGFLSTSQFYCAGRHFESEKKVMPTQYLHTYLDKKIIMEPWSVTGRSEVIKDLPPVRSVFQGAGSASAKVRLLFVEVKFIKYRF